MNQTAASQARGPLAGVRIIELAGIGPGPFAGMMLADHGAEVIKIERPGVFPPPADVLSRSRRIISVDLKSQEGVQVVRDLCASADGLIEGFRPGVTERLGIGPDVLLADNPRLVYGRMTGWGQDGPYAHAAGHDINYIALAGALHGFGRADAKPTSAINMVGDFGGGGMMLAFGMLAAILSARTSGRGQVIDCAMTEGSALLMAMIWGLAAEGQWEDRRGVNIVDSGAHFYDTYETADGLYISVGSVEPQFYALLRSLAGIAQDSAFDAQMDTRLWPDQKTALEAVFRQKTRAEWCALMEYTDVCFAPVLSMAEAPNHPHNLARETFVTVDGVRQPAPAPRYSATRCASPVGPVASGEALLRDLGYDAGRIEHLMTTGTVG